MAERADSSDDSFHQGVFWVTSRIAIGRFATPGRAKYLQSQGVTHLLNVSDAPSVISEAEFSFVELTDVPITDLNRIPDEQVVRCCDFMNRALEKARHNKIYVHCIAGQNRSPTVVWLYLVSCGADSEVAKRLIVSAFPDAIPGHSLLVDDALIAKVVSHGRKNNFTLRDCGISKS